MKRFPVVVTAVLALTVGTGTASAAWDGGTTLYNINLKPENFLDINSDGFRPAEDIRWYDVENGWRLGGGSLESDRAYLFTDLRIKRYLTPRLSARLRWADEEFYAPRQPDRPLLELELQPMPWPAAVSLLGAPAYDKGVLDLGVAASLGLRPWNYVRVAWLWPDLYYNSKHDIGSSYYRREPRQVTVETAYRWGERTKLRLQWQDNSPLEFVLDNRVSVFAYRNENYQVTFDFRRDAAQTFGIAVRGFDTRQSRDDAGTLRSQDIRYYSVKGYWIRRLDHDREWTLGVRYDDFRNRERTPADATTEFDYLLTTAQAYTICYLPFTPHQAWNLGLYLGDVSEQTLYLDPSVPSQRDKSLQAKLFTGWEIASMDKSSALTLGVSWNLDDLIADVFDGGSARFRTEF